MKKLIIPCVITLVTLTGCYYDLDDYVPFEKIKKRIEKHWAEPYIESLISSNIIGGYPDGKFYPDNIITREEAATMIYNMSGKVGAQNSHFSDVNPGENWSYEAINSVYEQKYISGYPDSTFQPLNSMTRGEFSVIVYNYLNMNGYLKDKEIISFPDTQEIWSQEQIGVLAKNQLVGGYEDGNFNPSAPITRGEAAKIISHVQSFVSENKPDEHSDIKTALIEGLSKFEPAFSFSYAEAITPEKVADSYKEDFRGTYYEGVMDNVSLTVRSSDSNSVINVRPQYLHSKEEEAILTEYVKNTAAEIQANYQTDYEKIKAAHDLIVTTTKYNDGDENSRNSVGVSTHSPYSIVSDGTGVCQAYALLNYRILEALGYNVLYVVGDAHSTFFSGPHAWNLVQIGSEWFHIDTTWDDPVPDILNRIKYDYFLVSDDMIGENHTWDRTLYPVSTRPYQ